MSDRSQVYSSCFWRHRSTSAAGSSVTSAAAGPTEATSSRVPYRSKATASTLSMERTLGGRSYDPAVPDPSPPPARGRQLVYLGLAAGVTVPGVFIARVHHVDLPDLLLAF